MSSRNRSRDVVLVGAGDLGVDALSVYEVLLLDADAPPPRLAGYLDDSPALHGKSVEGFPVLGPFSWLESRAEEFEALVTVGCPAPRAALRRRLRDIGVPLATWVHPTAVRSRSVSFGAGCLIMGATSFTVDVKVGRNVVINPGATVAHHARIGDDSVICPGVQIAGRVVVESRAFLATGAVVTPGCRVGEEAVVGAGAVVLSDVPPGARVGGAPAKPL